MQQSNNIVYIDINDIIPNANQPRKIFNETNIDELAISIKEYGILNPILVRKKEDKYEIIAGERRYRAAKIINLDKIPAIVKELDDQKALEIALIENLQRENLTPIEEADTYKKILDTSDITEQKLSEMLGKSQSAISNKMRLLNLTDEVKTALKERKISERHARSLLTIKDKNEQVELLNRIIENRLTVKELDNIINKKEIEKESDNMNNGNFFPNYNNLEQNNNVSLNTMNMQTMPTMETVPATNFNQPVQNAPIEPMAPVETPMQQPVNVAQPVAEMPQTVEPLPQMPTFEAAPTPEVAPAEPILPTMPTPAPEAPIPVNNFNDIPLFATQNQAPENIAEPAPVVDAGPVLENNPQPIIEPTPVVQETPLFNTPPAEMPAVSAPVVEPAQPTFEVPVETPPVVETTDKFTTVKNLLDSNNVAYKAYTGENGNCIIIEI